MTMPSDTKGFTIFFTGLPGSGKSTIGKILYERIKAMGRKVEVIDGDAERARYSTDLGFSKNHRITHTRRMAYMCELLTRNDVICIASIVSAYKEPRQDARSWISPRFIEVYADCPLEVLKVRDPKGLYKKALAGEIKNFTGIDDPYEPPDQPEVHLRTDQTTAEQCADIILARAKEMGFLP
jgi:adenylylsulfate kinase